jgi:hypothetical protein
MSTLTRNSTRAAKGPVTMLHMELQTLRRELRETVRAYSARLEISLAHTAALVSESKPVDELSREELHRIRELTEILRDRKLKPEKGRAKDLRKLDELIEELETVAQNGH